MQKQQGALGRPVRSGQQPGEFNEIFARIKQGLGGRSQADVARALGIGRAAVSDAKARGSIPADWFLKLARDPYYINPTWLESGTGAVHLHSSDAQVNETELEEGTNPTAFVAVPVAAPGVSKQTGGLDVRQNCTSSWLFHRTWLNQLGNAETMCMVQITGDSMAPAYMDGDMVLVDMSRREVQDGRVHVVRLDDVIMVKRLVKSPGKLQLASDNSAKYTPMDVDILVDNIDILGLVVWLGRSIV